MGVAFSIPERCGLPQMFDHLAQHVWLAEEAGVIRQVIGSRRVNAGGDHQTDPRPSRACFPGQGDTAHRAGETITENIAILDWTARQDGRLAPSGPMGHTHLLQVLAFISTEIHKSFKPFFAGAGDEEKAKAGETIVKRMGYLADTMKGDNLFGPAVTVADCYLFVMLLWAKKFGVEAPARLVTFRERMMTLPSVQKAMTHEGLI